MIIIYNPLLFTLNCCQLLNIENEDVLEKGSLPLAAKISKRLDNFFLKFLKRRIDQLIVQSALSQLVTKKNAIRLQSIFI